MAESHTETVCPDCKDTIFIFPGGRISKCKCDKEAEKRPVLPLPNVEPVSNLLSKPPMPVEWLVDNLFPAGYVFMIYSPEGVGKTVLSFNLAIAIASGTSFLGRKTHPGTVLYCDEENPDQYTYDILTKMCRARKIDPQSLSETFLMGRFALSGKKPEEWCSQLGRTIEILRPALMVLDTFSSILPNIENVENDNAIMKAYLRYLRIAKIASPETAILILHHPPRNADRPRGAGAIGQDVDAYYSLKRPKGRPGKAGDKHTILFPGKARRLAGVPTYRIRPKYGPEAFDLTGEIISP